MEAFEYGALAPGMSTLLRGGFNLNPGIKAVDSLGGGKSHGFGKSVCGAGCFFDYASSPILDLPEQRRLDALPFKVMQ
jgi:hypothetical protein